MNKFLVKALIVASAMSVAVAVSAGMDKKEIQKPTKEAVFGKLDQNADGSISIEEAADVLSAAEFDKIDVNQDGLISKVEYLKENAAEASKESVTEKVSSIVEQ